MSSGWDPPQQPAVEGLPAYQPAPGMPAPPPVPPGMAPVQPPLPPPVPGTALPDSAMEYAGWWQRVGARLIDTLLMLALMVVPIIAAFAVMPQKDNADPTDLQLAVLVAALLAGAAVWALYAPVTMRRSGQTPGKKLVGVRVVRDDRQPMTFGYAFVREFLVKGALINTIGGFVFLSVLNYLWPLWDDSNRALHDMIVSSHVVKGAPGGAAAPQASAWGP